VSDALRARNISKGNVFERRRCEKKLDRVVVFV
jgi:hypothetical protein